MPLDDRLSYALLGVVIGFFLGYITRTLRETKEELNEVHEILKDDNPRSRDERGAVSSKTMTMVALAIVVALAFFSSIQSQIASNKVTDTQDKLVHTQNQLDAVTTCNKTVLSEALNALNTRTAFTRGAASANLDLVKSQAKLFSIILHIPPYSQPFRFQATQNYNDSALGFIAAQSKAERNAETTKYPDSEDLATCITDSKEMNKKD